MSSPVVSIADLPLLLSGRHLLEGHRFGLSHLTPDPGDSPPGQGARLHRHDHEDLFVVHAGRDTYRVGDVKVETGPGQVVIVPAGVPHRFVNEADAPRCHTAMRASGSFVMEVLER